MNTILSNLNATKFQFLLRLILILVLMVFTDTAFCSDHAVQAGISEPTNRFMLWAFILGGFSAISLVLGSALGLVWQPNPRITAAFTAFGAGALLAALSVELIAPTVIEFVEQKQTLVGQAGDHDKFLEFVFLIFGCIFGGVLFFFLNEALNSSGGHLRKVSTTIAFFSHQQKRRYSRMVKHISKISLFHSIPPEHIDILMKHMRHSRIKAGKSLIHEGERVNKLYLIESGEVDIINNGYYTSVVGPDHFLGESAMLSGHVSSYSATARTNLEVFELTLNDIHLLKDSCPELNEILESEIKHEFNLEASNHSKNDDKHLMTQEWVDEALNHIHHTTYLPTQSEINETEKKSGSAPLSIWLGIFLDGIPESFVIGAGFLILLSSKIVQGDVIFTDVIPYTLIAGLFLSNFPEAMSSSIGMKKMGWKPFKILTLWTSLMIMTAAGAVFGYYFGAKIPNYIEIGVEGVASGAMLTMIAQTMIPEAVHIGGSRVTGLSTLAGYLSAVAFKIFE